MQSFYDALLDQAWNMAIFLNKFTLQEHFLEKISSEMLLALIWNRGLALEINTIKEFVSEVKAYESSLKTVVYYLEHNRNCTTHVDLWSTNMQIRYYGKRWYGTCQCPSSLR